MQVSGKVLTWTSPVALTLDGKEMISVLTFERIE